MKQTQRQQQQQQQQQLNQHHQHQQQQQLLGRGLVNNGFMSGQQAAPAVGAAAHQVTVKQEIGDPSVAASAAAAANPGGAQMAGGAFVDSTTRQQADNAALSDLFLLQENLKTGTGAFFTNP